MYYSEPVAEDDDCMTMIEFITHVRDGLLQPHDGVAVYANEESGVIKKASYGHHFSVPEQVIDLKIPHSATHVVWYNK